MQLDDLLARLDAVRPRPGGGWEARCPAHPDPGPSLSVDPGRDGRILLYCFAGCAFADVVAALGLAPADLFAAGGPAGATAPPARHLSALPPAVLRPPRPPAPPKPARVARLGETWYELRDAAGRPVACHRRVDWRVAGGGIEKDVSWWQPDRRTPGLAGVAVADLPLYGSELLASYPTGVPVALVEGEKAAEALITLGIPAVGTVTGAGGTPGPAALAPLAGRVVVLWPDADADPAVGAAHMARIGRLLVGVAAEVRWFAWRDAPPGGDAADWVARHPELEVACAVLANAPAWSPPDPSPPDPPPGRAGHTGCTCRAGLAREAESLRDLRRQVETLKAIQREINDTIGDRDLTPAERLVAIRLALRAAGEYRPEAPAEPLRMPIVALAEEAGLSRQTVSTVVERFAERGSLARRHVEYRDAATNERRVMLHVVPPPPPDDASERLPLVSRFLRLIRSKAPPRPAHGNDRSRPAPAPPAAADDPGVPCDACAPATPVEIVASCAGCGAVLDRRLVPADLASILLTPDPVKDSAANRIDARSAARIVGHRHIPVARRAPPTLAPPDPAAGLAFGAGDD